MANSTTAALQACPRCKSASDIHPLARDGDRQRFNCQRCSENFWGPAIVGVPDPESQTSKPLPGFAFAPISIPDRTATEDALPRGICEQCQKPYFSLGKRYEAHIAACDGRVKYVAKVPRKRLKRAPLDVPSAAQIYASSIASLLARRAALEAEIHGIDVAVAEIREKQGAGGPTPGPFTPSQGPPCQLSSTGRPLTP